MKNKRGFTLTEILVTIAILGVLLLIAVPTFTNVINKFRTEYYKKTEDTLLVSGKEYFSDNKDKLPQGYLESAKLNLEDLEKGNYIDKLYQYRNKNVEIKGYVRTVKYKDKYLYQQCITEPSNFKTNTENVYLVGSETSEDFVKDLCNEGWEDQTPKIDIENVAFYNGLYQKYEIEKKLIVQGSLQVKNEEDTLGKIVLDDYFVPENVDSIDPDIDDSTESKSYTVKYKYGNEIETEETGIVYIYQHPAPTIKKGGEILDNGDEVLKNDVLTIEGGLTNTIKQDISINTNSILERYEYSLDEGKSWKKEEDTKKLALSEGNGFKAGSNLIWFRTVGKGNKSNEVLEYGIIKKLTLNIVENYTITYNSNGGKGTMSNTTCEKEKECKISENLFTRDEYEFKGWNTDKSGNGTSYSNGKIITISSDLKLYAQWEEVQNPTIELKAYNSKYNEIANNSTIILGEKINYYGIINNFKVSPKSVNIMYSGDTIKYNCVENGEGEYICAGPGIEQKYQNPGKKTATITATYDGSKTITDEHNVTVEETYTLTYDSINGTPEKCSSITGKKAGEKWGTLCVPTKTNFTFDGWYTSRNGYGTKITSTTIVSGNTKVYALWKPNVFLITTDINYNKLNGGEAEKNTYVYINAVVRSDKQIENDYIYDVEFKLSTVDFQSEGYFDYDILQVPGNTDRKNFDTKIGYTAYNRYFYEIVNTNEVTSDRLNVCTRVTYGSNKKIETCTYISIKKEICPSISTTGNLITGYDGKKWYIDSFNMTITPKTGTTVEMCQNVNKETYDKSTSKRIYNSEYYYCVSNVDGKRTIYYNDVSSERKILIYSNGNLCNGGPYKYNVDRTPKVYADISADELSQSKHNSIQYLDGSWKNILSPVQLESEQFRVRWKGSGADTFDIETKICGHTDCELLYLGCARSSSDGNEVLWYTGGKKGTWSNMRINQYYRTVKGITTTKNYYNYKVLAKSSNYANIKSSEIGLYEFYNNNPINCCGYCPLEEE